MRTRLAGWYRTRRRGARFMLLAVLVALILALAYGVVRELALRNADHMTVTVTRLADEPEGRAGSVVYRNTFGRPLAATAERLLNGAMTHSYLDLFFGPTWGSQPYGGHAWRYQLVFTWHGIVVESAAVDTTKAPERYTLSALGMTDLRPRFAEDSKGQFISFINALVVQSGNAIPSAVRDG